MNAATIAAESDFYAACDRLQNANDAFDKAYGTRREGAARKALTAAQADHAAARATLEALEAAAVPACCQGAAPVAAAVAVASVVATHKPEPTVAVLSGRCPCGWRYSPGDALLWTPAGITGCPRCAK